LEDKIQRLEDELAKIRDSLRNEKRRASVLSRMLDSAKVGNPQNCVHTFVAETIGNLRN
jgi:hypothetical protein